MQRPTGVQAGVLSANCPSLPSACSGCVMGSGSQGWRFVQGVVEDSPTLLFSGPGSWGPFQNKNLDWFPRMRAMSLVSNEGEGEQNEIRILQEKLNCTMKLVSHLTAQLNELKEQVCRDRRPSDSYSILRAPSLHPHL